MSDDQPPLLHSINGAAARLGEVSESTVWRLIRSGKLRAVKVLGRTLVPESELQRVAQEGADPVTDFAAPTTRLPGAHPDPPLQRKKDQRNKSK